MKQLRIFASLLLAIYFSFSTVASEIYQTSATVMEKGMFSDGTRNYKTFTVESSSAGEFHIGFWLCASILNDNDFTSFRVYANNKLAGTITPDHDGWQTIGMDENKKVRLDAGLNTITISTTAPEIPEVENIRVSKDPEMVRFDSSAFEQYVEDAAHGRISADAKEEEPAISVKAIRPASMTVFSNANLNYTYYKRITVNKGDRIHIETESGNGHIVDMVYMGSLKNYVIGSVPQALTNVDHILYPDTLEASLDLKTIVGLTPATSEEIQRYNWTSASEVDEDGYNMSTLELDAPMAGMYMVLARTDDNSKSDIIDISISINGKSTKQRKQPICSSSYGVIIPADGYEYACMTTSYDADADPMLFVHGGRQGGIIGFNDDATPAKRKEHNLGVYDSYLSQTYLYPSTAVSVSNYKTENPVSKCVIITRMVISEGAQKVQAVKPSTSDIYDITDKDGITFPNHISLNTCFAINAGESTIECIEAYSIDGRCVGSVSVNSAEASLMATDLNITEKGLYTLRVHTDRCTAAKKLMAR